MSAAPRERAYYEERRRRKARAARLRRLAFAGAIVVLVGLALGTGIGFAGSSDRIASGVTVAGIDVGGMTAAEARKVLEERGTTLGSQPVVFTHGGKSFSIQPEKLGVATDWARAIERAIDQGGGFILFRGFTRLKLRFSGADVSPVATADSVEVERQVKQLAKAIDQPAREAAIVLDGTTPVVQPAQAGIELNREEAAKVLVGALAGFERGKPVALPVDTAQPKVTAADLQPVATQVRAALSAPVHLSSGKRKLTLRPDRLATLLVLPTAGSQEIAIGGRAARRYFASVAKAIDREPRDAGFTLTAGGKVRIVPSRDGRKLDVAATTKALLAAALAPAAAARTADLVVATAQPKLTTETAKTMGVVGVVSSYTTVYGGDSNRLHNVQLVSELIDDHLIAPGATFSFNETTGERNAEKGFLEAPVIINGELETGLGGGVCQVSTTVFNAAYDAGLPIDERTNHALYISHYPLGRDATVNYPDTDLKFTNDTGHWLWLRAFADFGSLTINLYGTPLNREVVTETSPLSVIGKPPVTRILEPDLEKGERWVEDSGEPRRSVSVRRVVYDEDGNVLYDATWYSLYRGEPKIVHIGTKPKEKSKPSKEPAAGSAGAGGSAGGAGSGESGGGGGEAGGGAQGGGSQGGGTESPPPSEEPPSEEPPSDGGGIGEPPPPPS